jgi:hypothetical protein
MAEESLHTRAKVSMIRVMVPIRLPRKRPETVGLSDTNQAEKPVTTRAMAIQAYTSLMRPGILMERLFSLSAVISSLYIERLLSETDSIYSLGYFYCITERKVPGRRGRAPWPYRFFYGPRAMPEAITSHAPRPGHFNLPSDTFRLPFSSESGLPPGPAYHRS